MWNKENQFKRNETIHFQEVNNSIIILNPVAGTSHELNESASFIWKILDQEKTYAEISSLFCDEYDVSTSVAQEDLDEFITEMNNQKLLVINE